MAGFSQNVSLTAPTDYNTEQLAIQRRMAMAQAMMQQGQEPLQTNQTAGGYVLPVSPMAGLAKALQQGVGMWGQRRAEGQEKELATKYQTDMADALTKSNQAMAGSPGYTKPEATTAEDGIPMSLPPEAVAAVKSNPQLAAQLLMMHPATQAMGMQLWQQAQQQAQAKAIMEGMGMGATSTAPSQALNAEQAAGGQAGPTNAAAARVGQPNGGFGGINPQAMGMALSGNPLLAKPAEWMQNAYAEAHKKTNMREGSTLLDENNQPIFTAPKGGQQTSWNNGQPSASLVPGAQELTARGAGLTAASEAYGKLPYQAPTSVNTEGAPTLLTPQQQIEATGAKVPPPAAIFPQPGKAQVTPAPVQAQRDADRVRILQEELTRATNPEDKAALQRELSLAQRGPSGVGLRLQDQGASAQQKTEGEKKGDLTYNAPQARAAVADASSNLERLVQGATQIMQNPALSGITGIQGVFPNMPGGKAADVQAQLGSLKSQVGFAVLQAMRDASKTGGALGAISDRENELLQRNLAALDTAQSPDAMKKSLQQVIDYAMGAKDRIGNAYRDQYERVQGNQGMQPTARGAQPAGGWSIKRVN